MFDLLAGLSFFAVVGGICAVALGLERGIRAQKRAAGMFARQRQITAAQLVRFVYTQNPFYVVSAALVLYGASALFRRSVSAENSLALLGVLCGYTALAAAAAIVIVRWGRVWEDARSLLLVLVFLFLAVSSSFDDITIPRPGFATFLLLSGLVFSVLVTECALRGLAVRLPGRFRVPYYALLTCFFLYPLYLRFLLNDSPPEAPWPVRLGIVAFPALCGALFLGLLPLARGGGACVRDNGTPWSWPAFPWAAFLALAFGVCARSYILSFAFDPIPGMRQTIFGTYFLAPFLLCAAAVVLELALEARRAAWRAAALLLPAAAIGLAFPGTGGGPYGLFLDRFMTAFGSPVAWTAWGAVLFYAYAWRRGCRGAEAAFLGALAAASLVGGATRDLGTLRAPHEFPLLVGLLAELWLAFRRPSSRRVFAATCLVLGVLSVLLRGTPFVATGGAVPLHLAWLGALAVGGIFRDRFARRLQQAGAAMVPVFVIGALVAEVAGWLRGPQAAALPLYFAFFFGLALAYGFGVKNPAFLTASFTGLGLCVGRAVVLVIALLLDPARPCGLLPLATGLAAFVTGGGISFAKGGVFGRARPWWTRARRLAGG
jgi:hypothetical protein